MNLIAEIEKEYQQKEHPRVRSGDEVALYLKVVEGGKERLQVFKGTVIGQKGSGTGRMLTVRKVSYGEGVERTVPLCSPSLDRIEVIKPAKKTRRAKHYFLRRK